MKEKLAWLVILFFLVVFLLVNVWLAEKINVSVGAWQKFGYWGIFIGALAVNATVILPIPFFLLPFALKLAEQSDHFFLGIFCVGVVYAAGAALGELSGYFAGLGFLSRGVLGRWIRRVFNNRYLNKYLKKANALRTLNAKINGRGEALYGAIERRIGFKQKTVLWTKKYGGAIVIILLAMFPSPFDALGIVLGSIKYPWWKFLLFTFLGRVPKYCLMIYLLHLGVSLVFH